MKMKKLLSFLLIFLLLFCVASISVNAAEYVQPITLDSNDGLFGWLKEVWYTITDIYDLLINIRNRITDTVTDAIINGFKGLWNYLDTITDYINSIRNSIVNGLTNAVTNGFKGLWNYFNSLDDRLGSVISLLTNAIPDAIKNGISNVIDYLSDLYDKLNILTSLIQNHLTDSFVSSLKTVRDYIADTYQKVHDLYNVINMGILNRLKSIWQLIVELPDNILAGLQNIFIPDVETLQADLEAAVENITSQFGIHFDTYDRLFDTEIAPEDVVENYNIPGIGTFKLKFLDTSYLIKGVAFFRPFIRGFLVLLLVFYNWKQALTLFDQNPAIAGGAIQGLSSHQESTQMKIDL